MGNKTLVFAHRGASGERPENTMAAFQRAVEMGAQGIECDVQLSKDGELVVIHDETLHRTTSGKGFVKDHTLEQLKNLDAGSWFGKEFSKERIPLLEELLELVRKHNRLLNIELKTGIIDYPGLEEKVLSLVDRFGIKDNIILSSFNHYSLVKVRELDKTVKMGALYMEGLYEPWKYVKALDCQYGHPFYLAVRPEIVQGYKAYGLGVNTFTVNEINQAKQLIAIGVDGIITDYPDRILGLVNQ